MTRGKRKRVVRLKSKSSSPPRWWFGLITGSPANFILALAALIAAIGYVWDVVDPVLDSGPFPLAGRDEVVKGDAALSARLGNTDMTVAETLDLARSANDNAQRAARQSDENRRRRLLSTKLDYEAVLKIRPDDKLVLEALSQIDIELTQLNQVLSQTDTPQK